MNLTLPDGQVALIDDDDAPRVAGPRWYAARRGHVWYVQAGVGRTTLYLHRVILNAPPGVTVDHVNHDGLDCRKQNLRLASQTQQNANQCKRAVRSSRFKGVHRWLDDGRVRWRAGVSVNGVQRRVSCATEIEAALVYNELAREAFGEFAVMNIVEPA